MGLFRRSNATTSASPTQVVLMPAQASPSPVMPPAAPAVPQASPTLLCGQRLREAVERGDLKAARQAWRERERAKASASGYPHSDNLIGFDDEVIRDAKTLPQVAELGLSAARTAELRIVLALNGTANLAGTDGVLGVLLGTDLPVWPRFDTERALWQNSAFTPASWPAVLLTDPPALPWQPAGLAALSSDARQVLAYPKLVRARTAVTRQFLAERTLLNATRLNAALGELERSGLATTPTVADRLGVLTVVQLRQAAVELGVASKGAKAALVASVAATDPDGVTAYLSGHHPAALAAEITVGVGADKAAAWLIAYAGLIAHWLTVGLLPTARQVADGGTAGWTVFKTDTCPVCRKAPSRVPRSRPQDLPPFHLGCRCAC